MRLLLIVFVVFLCILVTACGSFFVGFVSNPGGTVVITGTVTVVSVGFVQGPGTSTTSTSVTFLSSGSPSTIIFCGNQSPQFFLNQTMQAHFVNGPVCSTLVSTVILGPG